MLFAKELADQFEDSKKPIKVSIRTGILYCLPLGLLTCILVCVSVNGACTGDVGASWCDPNSPMAVHWTQLGAGVRHFREADGQ